MGSGVNMFFEKGEALDFSDVLLVPQASELSSRKEVDITRTFQFKRRSGNLSWSGLPICASNMDSVASFRMSEALNKAGMLCCLHKFHNTEENFMNLVDHLDSVKNSILTIGISDKDFEYFLKVFRHCKKRPFWVCIDVANGYTKAFREFVSKVRSVSDDELIIVAGNIVTKEMTQMVIEAGADIAKIGIGPGCFGAGTRILMSNGSYKNIEEIEPGDRVINMHGEPVTVKAVACKGDRDVISLRSNKFYKNTFVTPDHNYYVGDLNSTAKKTIASQGYSKLLDQKIKTRPGESKYKWKEISKTKKDVLLLPNNIKFEIKDSFELNLSEYFISNYSAKDYNQIVYPTYELGYLFGFFLGDGHARLTQPRKNVNSWSGAINFYPAFSERQIAEKLNKFCKKVFGKGCSVKNSNNNVWLTTLYSTQLSKFFRTFGKRTDKHLPLHLLCKDKKYLQGLYDGLIDSDGHRESKRDIFSNTSTYLHELFSVVFYLLKGYFPNQRSRGYSSSQKVTAKNESFSSRSLNNPQYRITKQGFEVVKILEKSDIIDKVKVYDIEVEDSSHSFIANNAIVHNSACETRKKTGVGYPQLSAILSCADGAHGLGAMIMGDGGVKVVGDFAKGFAAGADFMMAGGIFAGHKECIDPKFGIELIEKAVPDWDNPLVERGSQGLPSFSFPGIKAESFIKFRGMSSREVMEEHYGKVADHRTSEGKEVLVPFKGPVANTILDICGGLRSACTYLGAKKLKELQRRATFIKVRRQLNDMFGS